MELTCPACGANHNVNPGMISVVCNYCNTVSKIEREAMVSTGEKSVIMPFPTVFEVGSYFYAIENSSSNDKFLGKNVEYISDKEFYNRKLEDYLAKIYVYGQVRYTNEGGFWDDWFIRITDTKEDISLDKDLVLNEDEGLINIFKINSIESQETEVFNKDIGDSYNGGFIQETGTAGIEGYSGSFPFGLDLDSDNKYVNMLKDGKIIVYKKLGNNILYLDSL